MARPLLACWILLIALAAPALGAKEGDSAWGGTPPRYSTGGGFQKGRIDKPLLDELIEKKLKRLSSDVISDLIGGEEGKEYFRRTGALLFTLARDAVESFKNYQDEALAERLLVDLAIFALVWARAQTFLPDRLENSQDDTRIPHIYATCASILDGVSPGVLQNVGFTRQALKDQIRTTPFFQLLTEEHLKYPREPLSKATPEKEIPEAAASAAMLQLAIDCAYLELSYHVHSLPHLLIALSNHLRLLAEGKKGTAVGAWYAELAGESDSLRENVEWLRARWRRTLRGSYEVVSFRIRRNSPDDICWRAREFQDNVTRKIIEECIAHFVETKHIFGDYAAAEAVIAQFFQVHESDFKASLPSGPERLLPLLTAILTLSVGTPSHTESNANAADYAVDLAPLFGTYAVEDGKFNFKPGSLRIAIDGLDLSRTALTLVAETKPFTAFCNRAGTCTARGLALLQVLEDLPRYIVYDDQTGDHEVDLSRYMRNQLPRIEKAFTYHSLSFYLAIQLTEGSRHRGSGDCQAGESLPCIDHLSYYHEKIGLKLDWGEGTTWKRFSTSFSSNIYGGGILYQLEPREERPWNGAFRDSYLLGFDLVSAYVRQIVEVNFGYHWVIRSGDERVQLWTIGVAIALSEYLNELTE